MKFELATAILLQTVAVEGFVQHNARPTFGLRTAPMQVSFADDMMGGSNRFERTYEEQQVHKGQYQEQQRRPQEQQQEQQQKDECSVHTANIPEGMILSWEGAVEDQIRCEIANRAQKKTTTSNQPFMIGVVGIPGSGKSTSCSILTSMLSNLGCLLMPFDGYHYPVSTLLSMENSDDLIYRRGAPDTFDVDALKRDLETIRFGEDASVSVPGFDHALGDPEADAHRFDRDHHNVVITEGLYLLHDEQGWESVKNNFDMTIFVHADVDTCVNRLKIRNKCIPGYTPEEIDLRCEVVDRTNAWTVEHSKVHADLVVQSAAALAPAAQ